MVSEAEIKAGEAAACVLGVDRVSARVIASAVLRAAAETRSTEPWTHDFVGGWNAAIAAAERAIACAAIYPASYGVNSAAVAMQAQSICFADVAKLRKKEHNP